MSIVENKLRNIYNQLEFLLLQFKSINVVKINSLPNRIGKIVVGENKISVFVDRSIQEVTVDDLTDVTVIGQSAFYGCTSLTSVTIPDSVTEIKGSAFYGCTSLIDMYMYSTTPPTLERTNAISTATATIHVPIGSGDVYRTATNWSTFADKIVEDIEI